MKKRIVFILICFVLAISFNKCTGHQNNNSKIGLKEKKYVAACDSATLIKLIYEGNSTEISKVFKTLIHSNEDSCVLNSLDIVVDIYINKPSLAKFIILNELSCSFDGYITEYFVDVFPKIFKSNSGIFFKHLFEFWKTNKDSNCILGFFRLYLSSYDVDKAVPKAYNQFWNKNDNKEMNSFYQNLLEK